MKAFIALLLLSGAAFAEQPCPVAIVKFFPIDGPTGSQTYIQWENTTDKTITGVRFGAYYLSLGEKRDFFEKLEYNSRKGKGRLDKPHKRNYASWFVFQDRTQSGGAWVDKVQFEDGTSWQDDGSRSCMFERKAR